MHKSYFEDLFRLLKLIGGKFIIVEDGKPRAVLMDFKEFEELAVPQVAGELVGRIKEIEEVNRQITTAQLLDLREEVIAEELDTEEKIRIEPLP